MRVFRWPNAIPVTLKEEGEHAVVLETELPDHWFGSDGTPRHSDIIPDDARCLIERTVDFRQVRHYVRWDETEPA